MKKNSITPVIIGLIFVIIGVGYIGKTIGMWDDFTIFFKGWWTMFIILPCLIRLINRGFSMPDFIGILIGLFLLVMQQTGIQMLRNLMIPVLLIGIGMMIIFKNNSFTNKRVIDSNITGTFHIPSYTAVFSSKSVVIKGGEEFIGASATSLFGGIELDLRNAVIKDDIIIDVDTVFAGMDIKLPVDVTVVSEVSGIFAGVDIKYNSTKNNANDGKPIVKLTGSCVFAGITVR